MPFGEADVLARAKNTSVDALVGRGVLFAQKGIVRLLERREIAEKITIKIDERCIWLLTQQLVHAFEKGGIVGAATIVAGITSSAPEHAKTLAYRLYLLSERKGWNSEALAYNNLVSEWHDVVARAAELKMTQTVSTQGSLLEE